MSLLGVQTPLLRRAVPLPLPGPGLLHLSRPRLGALCLFPAFTAVAGVLTQTTRRAGVAVSLPLLAALGTRIGCVFSFARVQYDGETEGGG